MEQVISQKKVKRERVYSNEEMRDVRADMLTLGGALILAVAILMSLVFVMTLLFPRGNGLQLVIIIALTLVSWGFLLNCATEKLSLRGEQLIFSSMLSRTLILDLSKIESYKLVTLGLRLDGNMYLIEIEHEDNEVPEEIWLSPCWKKQDLKNFCDTLGVALEEVNS